MKRLCLVILLVVLLAFPSNVRADVAPPIYPPGSNPQPGTEATQVRMAAETVLIEVQRDITPQSLGRAHVTADFTMNNLGTTDESMAVRFPISANDGRGQYPEISNLQIMVNGRQVQYRRVNYPDVHYQDQSVPWAEFDVTFPAGKDVPIHLTYDLQGSGYYPYTAFYYILATGAGWKDTIGSADVILSLPYKADPENVITNLQIGWAETTPDGVFLGNEVRWHFENFEPGANQPAQNMEFVLVAPSAWEALLKARTKVDKNPKDAEAWGMLAKAYKQVFFLSKGYREDSGGQQLYALSITAYERCLSLKPNDAQWHAGFADLLANHATWESSPWGSGPTPELFRALNEIHTALELSPNDPIVRGIAQNMTYMTYGGIIQNGNNFDFPWLTQTPTTLPPTPTTVPVEETTATSAPVLTDTPQSQVTPPPPTPTNVPSAPQKSSPLCGSAVLIPFLVMIGFAWRRR